MVSLIFGFGFLAQSDFLINILFENLSQLGSSIIILFGLFLAGIGILSLFVGYNLRKAKKWAGVTAVVFASVGIVYYIY